MESFIQLPTYLGKHGRIPRVSEPNFQKQVEVKASHCREDERAEEHGHPPEVEQQHVEGQQVHSSQSHHTHPAHAHLDEPQHQPVVEDRFLGVGRLVEEIADNEREASHKREREEEDEHVERQHLAMGRVHGQLDPLHTGHGLVHLCVSLFTGPVISMRKSYYTQHTRESGAQ